MHWLSKQIHYYYSPWFFIMLINKNRFSCIAFQLKDICKQVCNCDICETIWKIPKNQPKTYNRILSRINKMGNAKHAKKTIFGVTINEIDDKVLNTS